jgi:Arc/MetJ family transcription regulator
VRQTVALTQVDIDKDALAEAMRLSGARTKTDTVNLALREFVTRHRRIAAIAEGSDFDGDSRPADGQSPRPRSVSE